MRGRGTPTSIAALETLQRLFPTRRLTTQLSSNSIGVAIRGINSESNLAIDGPPRRFGRDGIRLVALLKQQECTLIRQQNETHKPLQARALFQGVHDCMSTPLHTPARCEPITSPSM
jgi:hypothetical protein